MIYQRSLKDGNVADEVGRVAKKEGSTLEKIAEDPKGAVKNIVNPK